MGRVQLIVQNEKMTAFFALSVKILEKTLKATIE